MSGTYNWSALENPAGTANWTAIYSDTIAITEVSTATVAHGDAISVDGLGFGATQGASTITIETADGSPSTTQTPTYWSDTSINLTVDTEDLPFGSLLVKVTVSGNSAASAVTHAPTDGYAYVTADVPATAGTYTVVTDASAAVADGDQIQYEDVTNQGAEVSMNVDGTFTIATNSQTHTFRARAYDATDETWGSWATFTINGPAPGPKPSRAGLNASIFPRYSRVQGKRTHKR